MLELIPILIAIGLGAGALGSMLGVGGGIIIVPFLTYFGLAPSQISSSSLFSVLSTSISSTVEYSRQKRIEYAAGLKMAAFAAPGAILGALLTKQFTIESFRLYFGILLILTGLYILSRKSLLEGRTAKQEGGKMWKSAVVYASSFGAGMISSLFGVGGGIVFVPLMLIFMGIGMLRAAPTSQLILLITSAFGVITHAYLGNPEYSYAAALAVGSFAGAQIGSRLSARAKELFLERILGIVLAGIGIKFIVDWATMTQARV